MPDERDLAKRLIESGLVSSDDLVDEPAPTAPAKYELVREIGRGGGGRVWLARDRDLARPVALKFLDETRRHVLERFRREARFAASLESPSIVRVYELGEHDGTPYISMQYVDGGSLASAVLSTSELVSVAREVARALHDAHVHGIVHRDIKPENVLLDRQGRAYVTDFGIARDVTGGAGVTISHDGQIMGTPATMSPEQARGELHAVDARSDVFALGVTLYRKLTGRWPFEGEAVVDVLYAVMHAEPKLPRSLDAQIPRALEAIVMRCLRKEKRLRYATMLELEDELGQFGAGRPVASESKLWFSKLVRKLAPGAADAGQREPQQRSDEAFWRVGMKVARDLAAWDADLYRVSRNVHRKLAELDEIANELEHFLAERPETAWARHYLGVALFRRGRLDAALDHFEASIDRVGHLAGAYFELGRLYLAIHVDEQERARRHLSSAGTRDHLRSVRGRLRQAVGAFEEARRLDPKLAGWQLAYADAVARLADDDFDGCVAACDAILADDPDAEEVWSLRGDALRYAGDDPFESYERALTIRRSAWGVCLAMAEARLDRGQLDEARDSIERALAIHPECARALELAARLEGERGAIDEALELAQRAVRADPRSEGACVAEAEVFVARGVRDGERGDLDRALDALERAKNLPGCQNRRELVAARARFERARLLLQRGEDGSEDLAAVMAQERARGATETPDPGPWLALLDQARALAKTHGLD